jgi:hypothetical protein
MNMPRQRITEVLQLLSSKEAQIEYQRDVPIADVSAELLCMWFDDLGDVWLSTELSSKERDRLELFNRFYAKRAAQLPKNLEEMHNSVAWQEVIDEARDVLIDLGWGE